MSFERTHKTITYLLVAVGVLVLIASGELPPAFGGLFVPLIVASWFVGGDRRFGRVGTWNLILIAALGLVLAIAFSTGDWLRSAIYFASLMVLAKLFQTRRARDYFQLYALSFLQIVAGAIINPTLWFALGFLLYVVLLTWSLVLLHLMVDMEMLAARDVEAGPDAHPGAVAGLESLQMQRLIGPGFLLGTSTLALGVFALSIGVFLFFPRLGLGFFGQHQRQGTAVTGFDANGMDLGHFGTLKQDQTIIARVEIDGTSAEAVLPLRLRGITFDRYQRRANGGFGWDKSTRTLWQLARTDGRFLAVHQFGAVPRDALAFTQRVFLEPMQIGRRTIFGEARVVGVRDLLDDRYVFDPRKRTRFYVDDDDDVVFASRGQGSALRYEVKSLRIPRHPRALRESGTRYHPSLARYLVLPSDLDPRIGALARQVTQNADNPFDKAARLEGYLRTQYRYSLQGGHDPTDPLADFLFGRREGHCEYFASALVVLARSVGVPARVVGGFYGGQYNPSGDYIAVRQADAHSWVEVWFNGYGWQVFDATPSSGALAAAEDSWLSGISRYFDSLQLLWYKWVIRWDLERQLSFLRGIGKRLRGVGRLLPRGIRTGPLLDRLRGLVPYLLGLLLLGLVWRRRGDWRRYLTARRRRGPAARAADSDRRAARRLYQRLLAIAIRRGIPVSDGTTAAAVLACFRALGHGDNAEQVISAYQEVVFGARALPPARIARARQALVALKAAR